MNPFCQIITGTNLVHGHTGSGNSPNLLGHRMQAVSRELPNAIADDDNQELQGHLQLSILANQIPKSDLAHSTFAAGAKIVAEAISMR